MMSVPVKVMMEARRLKIARKANVYEYLYRAGDKDDIVKDRKKAHAHLARLIKEGRVNDDYTCKSDGGSKQTEDSNDN